VRRLLVALAALTLGLPLGGSPLPPSTARAAQEFDVRQGGQTIEIQFFGDVVVGQPVSVEFRAANPAPDANQGSITVSLTGDPGLTIEVEAGDGAKVYRPGEPMYNFGSGQNVPIRVPAIELYVNPWPAGSQRVLRLRLTASQPYTIQARASFRRGNGSFVHLPGAGAPDQQGAPTRLIDVAPKSAQAPTATPAPPTATVVPPSATPAPATATAAPPIATRQRPTATTAAQPAAPGAPATNTPGSAPAVPAPPASGQAGPSSTPAPTPPATSANAPARSGGSWPLLLAGLGIIAVGIAIGLVALMLVLRRRAEPRPAPPPVWAGYPPGGYGPGPYGYPPPGGYPSGPNAGGQYPGDTSPSGGGPAPRPPTPAPTAPWERPLSPAPDSSGSGWNRRPGAAPWDHPATPAPPPGRPPSSAWPSDSHERPTAGSTYPAPGLAEDETTPRPASVGGVMGHGPATPTNERYVQRTLVGRGGMGSVYRAYDSRLRRWVALKVMHADLGLRPGFVDRFIREAQMAAMLEHPNIVTVYDIEQLGDAIQMVMSWIEGEDLQHILEREQALPPERAARLLDQLASALDNAHLREHPVLHRDIKPSNIMVAPNDRVVLTDFGIARLIGDVSLTLTGQIVGTPAYMAPELVQGEEADGRADVYAVGVVLYQMLTGQAPFHAQTPLALLHAQLNTPAPAPRLIAPSLPVGVDAVLLKALAKDPNARYQTAGDLARAFRAAIGHG
jgi:hypothetical protein